MAPRTFNSAEPVTSGTTPKPALPRNTFVQGAKALDDAPPISEATIGYWQVSLSKIVTIEGHAYKPNAVHVVTEDMMKQMDSENAILMKNEIKA